MAGKRLCALVSVSVLVALGLIAIVLGELPTDRVAEATTTQFASDNSESTARPTPAADLRNEAIRLQPVGTSDGQQPLTIRDFIVDDPVIAAPRQPSDGLDSGTIGSSALR